MKSVIALVAVAGMAAAASASPLTGLFRWEASKDGGATWSSAISVTEGSAYKLRGVASWTDDATPSIGLAGVTFDEIQFNGAVNQGELSGFASHFKQQGTAETWALYDITGGVKIDNATVANKTNFGQLPQTLPGGSTNPNFKGDNPFVVFTMDMTAGAGAHVVTVTGVWSRLPPATPSNEFKVYTTLTGTSKKPTTEATQTNGVITVTAVPAPASMALIGLGGLVAGRRRRA